MTNLGVDPFASSSVLGVLGTQDREHLAQGSAKRSFDRGQIVFFEGQSADSIMLLLSGELKVSTYSSDGSEFIIATVDPGETIGELGVFANVPRSATVTAVVPSVALRLPQSAVMELIQQQPILAVAMLKQLANMVRASTGIASDLVFLDLTQRVAKLLLTGMDRATATNEIRITQAELAARVGASRQRVNACLQELQRQGFVSLSSGRVRVQDPESLQSLL